MKVGRAPSDGVLEGSASKEGVQRGLGTGTLQSWLGDILSP